MNWNSDQELDVAEDATEVITPKKPRKVSKRYVAVVGINFDKPKTRIEPGDEVPAEFLQNKSTFNWLLNQKKAIKEVRGDQ